MLLMLIPFNALSYLPQQLYKVNVTRSFCKVKKMKLNTVKQMAHTTTKWWTVLSIMLYSAVRETEYGTQSSTS